MWSDAAREAAALARKNAGGKHGAEGPGAETKSAQQRGEYSLKAQNRTAQIGRPGDHAIRAGGKEYPLEKGAHIRGQDVHLKGGKVIAGETITHVRQDTPKMTPSGGVTVSSTWRRIGR